MRANPKLNAHKKPFWCLLITLIVTIICDILAIVIQQQETKYFRENAPIFFAFYFPDLVLVAVLTWAIIKFRQVELQALIDMGIFKDLDEMNDREMFTEYDKMIKQSKKVRNQYGKARNSRARDPGSDTIDEQNEPDEPESLGNGMSFNEKQQQQIQQNAKLYTKLNSSDD